LEPTSVWADALHGRARADKLGGGGGDDYFNGGEDKSRDRLFGGVGNDTLDSYSVDGALGDYYDGGPGYDILSGGFGDDVLKGGEDRDAISGYRGDDEIYSGPGGDQLRGGFGGFAHGTDRIFAVDGEPDHIYCTTATTEIVEADASDGFEERSPYSRRHCDSVTIVE
jgi:Ca2+-binding RTX toxin-like protein